MRGRALSLVFLMSLGLMGLKTQLVIGYIMFFEVGFLVLDSLGQILLD